MSRSNGQQPDWRDIDNTPEREEYEKATEGKKYAKDFIPALEALVNDRAATYGQRFLALLKRRSWGNYRLYALNKDGQPAIQEDFARELGIDKRIISNLANYYEKRGYLYRKAKLLYPTISPNLTPIPEKVTDASDFFTFLETWKVTCASDFSALEVHRSEVERLRKVQLAAYRQWRATRTNGAPQIGRAHV